MNETWITHTYKTHNGLDLGGIITLFLTLYFFIHHMEYKVSVEFLPIFPSYKSHKFCGLITLTYEFQFKDFVHGKVVAFKKTFSMLFSCFNQRLFYFLHWMF
jgi:hypothetical protein